jgi:hypothetical protein
MRLLISTSAMARMVYLYNLIMIKNIQKVESLDYIKFYDIRPEFFQYNMSLFVIERKIFVKQTLLEEKAEQVAIELQKEEKVDDLTYIEGSLLGTILEYLYENIKEVETLLKEDNQLVNNLVKILDTNKEGSRLEEL